MQFKDVQLRTRRVLSLYKVYGDSPLLVLNGILLNSVNALLALSRRFYPFCKTRIHHNSSEPVTILENAHADLATHRKNKISVKWNPDVSNYFAVKIGGYHHGSVDNTMGTQTWAPRFKSTRFSRCANGETVCLHCLVCRIGLKAVHLMLA